MAKLGILLSQILLFAFLALALTMPPRTRRQTKETRQTRSTAHAEAPPSGPGDTGGWLKEMEDGGDGFARAVAMDCEPPDVGASHAGTLYNAPTVYDGHSDPQVSHASANSGSFSVFSVNTNGTFSSTIQLQTPAQALPRVPSVPSSISNYYSTMLQTPMGISLSQHPSPFLLAPQSHNHGSLNVNVPNPLTIPTTIPTDTRHQQYGPNIIPRCATCWTPIPSHLLHHRFQAPPTPFVTPSADGPLSSKSSYYWDTAKRSMVVTLRAVGYSADWIVSLTGIPKRTVYGLCQKALNRGFNPTILPISLSDSHVIDGKRSGRSRTIIDGVVKQLLAAMQSVTGNSRREKSADAIAQMFKTSASTILRAMKLCGFRKTKPTRKPGLTATMRAARLAFCLAHAHWTLEDWKRVIWSDETSVVIGHRRGSYRIWRLSHERFLRSTIRP